MRHITTAIGAAALLAASLAMPAGAATPKDTLVIAWNLDNLYTFDPAQIGEVTTDEIMNAVCDPLILQSYESSKELIPGIAQSWSISEDGKQWTFKIRKGLKTARPATRSPRRTRNGRSAASSP